jgi:hypothetical protein
MYNNEQIPALKLIDGRLLPLTAQCKEMIDPGSNQIVFCARITYSTGYYNAKRAGKRKIKRINIIEANKKSSRMKYQSMQNRCVKTENDEI